MGERMWSGQSVPTTMPKPPLTAYLMRGPGTVLGWTDSYPLLTGLVSGIEQRAVCSAGAIQCEPEMVVPGKNRSVNARRGALNGVRHRGIVASGLGPAEGLTDAVFVRGSGELRRNEATPRGVLVASEGR